MIKIKENTELGGARRHMNYIGFSLIGLLLLQLSVSFCVYYIMAKSTGAQVGFYGFTVDGYYKTMVDIRKAIGGSAYIESLPLLFATLIGNIVPFLFCVRGVDVGITQLFSRPKVSGGTSAIYGVIGLGGSLVAGIVINIISLLLRLVNLKMTTPDLNIPWQSPLSAALMIITAVVIAPLTEEFICRGIILTVFRRYGDVFAVVASSLVWALLHGNFIQGVPVFVMGLFFGMLAVKSGSILPTIILHALNNALSLIESTVIKQNSMPISLSVSIFNLSIIAAAFALFIAYYKKIKNVKRGESKSGFKVFFTCVPVLIAIIFCVAITVLSVQRV